MIPIENIYYMLSYAFKSLRSKGYAHFGKEQFENATDLLSAILCKGIALQIKSGLKRNYIEREDLLSSLHGKIDISASLKRLTINKRQLCCRFDEFLEDFYLNQILKTVMLLLLRYEISPQRKKEIRNLLVYFSEVRTLEVKSINWKFRYNRNNKNYELLLSACYLIVEGLLQTAKDGSLKLMNVLDEQLMCRLYEKFILEYYRKHYPNLRAQSARIDWALDDGESYLLPVMQSDIMLSCNGKILIIDAKYYSHTTRSNFNVKTLLSANLYQIFSYVKNKAVAGGEVAGMLLYAQTDEDQALDNTYLMSGNKISVKSLDLNCHFSKIAEQLNAIAEEFFF